MLIIDVYLYSDNNKQKTQIMKTLFNIQDLKDLAATTNALFFQDSNDSIRLVYKVGKKINYTDKYFGSEENGFWKYYN